MFARRQRQVAQDDGVRRLDRRAVVLVAAAAALAVAIGSALPSLRGDAADGLISLRNSGRAAPSSVVVVALDPRTTARYGRPPIPRSLYARALRNLDAAGAKVLVVDVQFTEPTDSDEDLALVDGIDAVRAPVVLGTSEVLRRRVNGRGPVVVDTDVLGGRGTLDDIGASAASATWPLGADAKVREIAAARDGLPTIAAEAARKAGGPTVPAGGMLLDPTVPASRLKRLSLASVISGNFDALAVRGRVVVIGSEVAGAYGDDSQFVAGSSDPIFGVEIHAQAIATALAGAPLSAAPLLTWLLALLAAAAGLVSALRARLRGQLGVLLVALGVIVGVVVGADVLGWLADPVIPLLVLAATGVASIAFRVAVERGRRAAARATLSRFVPPGVVDDLLRDGSDGRIAPAGRTATIMFCDLRGYTALTAGLSRPGALVDVLDAYLGAVSEVVYAHGGTVVSFQGDGVMAAFGVPTDDGRAAEHAIAATRALLSDALPRVRRDLAETLGEGPAGALALGVGVATGPVFAGTVGPPARREYAVVGPTTNLAARLQARTKEEAGPVLIDDATVQATSEAGEGDASAEHGLTRLGEREIRGLSAPITCWTL